MQILCKKNAKILVDFNKAFSFAAQKSNLWQQKVSMYMNIHTLQ